MSENLLKNPGFEAGWTAPVPHIQIPEHWHFDRVVGDPAGGDYETVEPELRVMLKSQLPTGEFEEFGGEGKHILKLFKGHGAISAWLEQDVSGLVVGQRYRLTVPVYVDTFVWDDGKQPPQANEGPDDRAAVLRLVARETGSWLREAYARFDEANVADWYLHHHEPTLEFMATTSTMLVRFEVWNPWPISNNGWFFDDLHLVAIDQEPEPPSGGPRVQYSRIYNVIPAAASTERAVSIFRERWEASRETVGGSYDDAGVGALEDKTAMLWDIPAAARGDFERFYREHYPGTKVRFRPTDDWDAYLLAQGDPRWADYIYADGDCFTLASKGCFVTCAAIAQRILGIDRHATPVTVDQALGSEGYTRCHLLHSAMREKLGLQIAVTGTEATALEHVAGGGLVFIEVQPTSLEHFVVGVEHEGDWLVLDPLWGAVGWLVDTYDGVESFRLISRYEESPEPPELQPTKMLAFHAQCNREGLPEAAGRLGAIKVVEDIGMLEHMPANVFVVARNWLDRDQIQLYTQAGPERHFEEQLRPWLDQYPQIDAIEDGMNEEVAPHNDGKNEWCAWWAVTTARLVREYTGGRVKTVMLNPGPGAFPLEGEGIRLFADVFRVSDRYGDYVGIHPYTPAIGDLTWINEWYPLRFKQVDRYARGLGYRPLYLGTEYGPIGGSVEWRDGVAIPHLNAGAGWRSELCLGGDWTRHQQVVRATVEPIIEWNSRHGNRFRYMFLFTIAGDWGSFRYDPGNIAAVAALADVLGV